ncbi:MAG: hypothetical protein RL329_2587 [Bacteroidota bacterium]|jgi:hypothetical protein
MIKNKIYDYQIDIILFLKYKNHDVKLLTI